MSLSGDIISDMELDASIEAIGEIAGSINLDGSGSTPTITASATVSPDPGIPACDVVKTGTDEYPNFAFNFSGLKGEQGSQGVPGQDGADGSDGITPDISATASASNTTGVPAVTVTKTGTDAAPNFDFYFENLKGERGLPGPTGETGPQGPSGNDGVTPNITATGSVTNTTGVPSVTITKTGTDLAPTFDFAFENIKGEQGVQGEAGRNGSDGEDGVTPIVSATASADDQVGIPNVVVTRSGTDTAPNFDFAFHNIKGTQGERGEGVPDDSAAAIGSVITHTATGSQWISPSASTTSYDNTVSGLTATDVQDAIDENAADITEIKSNLTHLTSSCTSANSNVTIGSVNTVARSVDVVQVSLVFTTASQIATNTNIIKMPYKALCDSVIPIRADSGTLFLLTLTAGSEYISVYGTAALGAGNFRGSFTYICQ